jgi:hypothetical protein
LDRKLFENFNYVFVAEFLMFISSLKIPEVDGSSQIFMEVKKVESHLSLVVAYQSFQKRPSKGTKINLS